MFRAFSHRLQSSRIASIRHGWQIPPMSPYPDSQCFMNLSDIFLAVNNSSARSRFNFDKSWRINRSPPKRCYINRLSGTFQSIHCLTPHEHTFDESGSWMNESDKQKEYRITKQSTECSCGSNIIESLQTCL